MYVDFGYYTETYGGTILTEADFVSAAREAETYIRYLTYLKGNIFADMTQEEAVKGAVCAAAEAYSTAKKEQEQGGNLKSESKDGLSVSFVVSRKDGETVEDYIKRSMYQAIRIRLLPTGWMGRKVGCGYDHECGCRDSL